MAKLTPFQKLKRAVSRLSVTSGSKFIQPDFEDSDIEFNANTYRPDFVSESRPDFASGSSKNYKNISQTSPPLFYSNDDLNFNYPSVGLNPHEASSSQAASFERTTFRPSIDTKSAESRTRRTHTTLRTDITLRTQTTSTTNPTPRTFRTHTTPKTFRAHITSRTDSTPRTFRTRTTPRTHPRPPRQATHRRTYLEPARNL